MSRPYEVPQELPPGSKSPTGERFGEVVFLRNRKGELNLFPLPLASCEIRPLKLPSGSVLFPVHPAFVAHLYASAVKSLESCPLDWHAIDRGQLTQQIWLHCLSVFRPGDPVRAGYERLTSGDSKPSIVDVTPDENRAQRIDLLARCLVMGVLSAFALEAS